MEEIINKRLTFLSLDALTNLKNNIEKTKDVEGNIIETGCALGGSAICMALYKKKDKEFNIYDVFGMIPPPTVKDDTDVRHRYNIIRTGRSKGIGNDVYYGYHENLLEEVINNFNDFNIEPQKNNIKFIKGLYRETLLVNQPVSFAHIDCDFYDPVMNSLEQIIPNLSVGGIITIDDYYCWSGARKATDEYFKFLNKKDFKFETVAGKLNIERLSK